MSAASVTIIPAGPASASSGGSNISSDSGHGGFFTDLKLLTVAAGHGPDVWKVAAANGGRLNSEFGRNMAVWRLPDAAVAALHKAFDKNKYVTIADWTAPQTAPTTRTAATPFTPQVDAGSLYNVADTIGATDYWKKGYTGAGVDVAIIDSGVAPLPEFDGRLVNGPDLSFDAAAAHTDGDPTLDGIDAYGHGTHIAGIIGGRTPLPAGLQLPTPTDKSKAGKFVSWAQQNFAGIAPGSRIINVRAGAADGAVDVSQIIAGIDWVVDHRSSPDIAGGLNIRVLNLSFGTDGPLAPDGSGMTDPQQHDALEAAVEKAWDAGIVVVASAGNDGFGRSQLDDPAIDPYVVAVGASDSNDTVKTSDDTIADFSSRGNAQRHVDVLAPGRSITSLAVPNSMIDQLYPEGRVGTKYFKGSGTSQSAGVVSGAAALLVQSMPDASPALIKALLMNSGTPLKGMPTNASPLDKGLKQLSLTQVGGALKLVKAGKVTLEDISSSPLLTTDDLSLEVARGTYHVSYTDADGTVHVLQGEVDVTGQPWDGRMWRDAQWDGRMWRDELWDGRMWRGGTWDGRMWRSRGWSAGAWQSSIWQGRMWRNNSWQAG